MGNSFEKTKQKLNQKKNFCGSDDCSTVVREMYQNDIDEAFGSQEAKFEAVSALIRAHPVLNGAVSKHLPEDYSGMLCADGFFDMLSPEETEILHKELCSMIKTMA